MVDVVVEVVVDVIGVEVVVVEIGVVVLVDEVVVEGVVVVVDVVVASITARPNRRICASVNAARSLYAETER